MRRVLPLLVVAAVALPTAATAGERPSSRRYTVAQVAAAFASQGLSLRSQHVPASAGYERFATRTSLRVIVFRKARPAVKAIEVMVGARPRGRHGCRGCIVIHLGPPRGWMHHVQENEFANVALVYLEYHGLGLRVHDALATLRRS